MSTRLRGPNTEIRKRAPVRTSLRLDEALSRVQRLSGHHMTDGEALTVLLETWMRLRDEDLRVIVAQVNAAEFGGTFRVT